MAESIKSRVRKKCQEMGIPLVGFAPVERWENPPEELPHHFEEWIPPEFWPQSIYPEAKTVIVIGLPVQLPILETAPSIFYHELYHTINQLLDEEAYLLSNYLTSQGHPSIYLPRDGYGDIEVLLKKPLAFFSHKHAAYLAGLGSIGWNNVLLTPEYGPRVRFTSIFTTASLDGDPIIGYDLCTRCLLCARTCPVHALATRKDEHFPPPMEKINCANRSRKLRKKYQSPCGICIKVCPVGMDRVVFGREDTSLYSQEEGFEEYHRAWAHVKNYGSKK